VFFAVLLNGTEFSKKTCCHFLGFSIVLNSSAPFGAGANCFCLVCVAKQQQPNNIGGTDEV
jgi:hypothetical protein